MARRTHGWILIAAWIALSGACGGESSADPATGPQGNEGLAGTGATDSPPPPAATSSATSGIAGSGTEPTSAPAGAPPAASAVICGGAQCGTPPLGTPGCCTVPGTGESGNPYENTGRAPDLCGTDLGAFVPSLTGVCLQMDQPGDLDVACPNVSNGFADEVGCCTDEGFCGTMSASAGLGCHYPMTGKGAGCGN